MLKRDALFLTWTEIRKDWKQHTYYNADEHSDESVKEEADVGVSIEPEDYCFPSEETNERSFATDLLKEDTDQEESTNTAWEKSKDGIEIVEKRKDVPCCHQ